MPGKLTNASSNRPGIRPIDEFVVHVVFRLADRVVADARRVEPVERFAATVENPGTDRGEHPFVSADRHEVDAELLHVDLQRAHPLDGVDVEQDALLAAQGGGAGDVVSETVGELHGAQRHDTGSAVHRGPDVIDQDAPGAVLHPSDFDAQTFQPHPAIDVGRVLDVG